MTLYSAAGFFALRTPNLPFEDFLKLSQSLRIPTALQGGQDLGEALTLDRLTVRARLQDLVRRPEVKEALWLASPEFYESLALWWADPESEKGQRLEQSLYRYLARMTSRATPFGLFAGCSTGVIGDKTHLEIGGRSGYRRRSRLDMEYLCNLAEKVSSDPVLRGPIYFHPNTSIYFAAGKYHHAQAYYRDKLRLYRLIATDHTFYLEATLKRAAHSATARELAEALVVDDPEIALEDAEGYIGNLIETQLLVCDLVPPLTGPEPIEYMVAQLNQDNTVSLVEPLMSISTCLRGLDEAGVGADLGPYQKLVNIIEQLPAAFKVEHIVQVDVMKPAPSACLDHRLVSDVLRAVEVLRSVTSSAPQESITLFKQAFQERYQDQEVPLMEALDEEAGIGFETKDGPGSLPEPLLEGIDFVAPENEPPFKVAKSEIVLARKVDELLRSDKTSLLLDAKLLQELRIENPLPLPDSFSVTGALCSPLDPASANRYSFYLQNTYGPSGANLMGRFCHADAALCAGVAGLLRAEEDLEAGNNVAFAEIAHLPEGRTGNVLYRPLLRKYEIPYLATSSVAPERQIPVTDLLVSIRNERIVLRSRKLNCEVRPRLTNAHAYFNAGNLNLYKFLCYLQFQGVAASLFWNWGILEQTSTFLPRVSTGNVILSPARWILTKEMAEGFAEERSAGRIRRVHRWRESRGIPRFAFLVESDNRLLIDFDNVLSVETLVEYVKKRAPAVLVEMLPGPEALCTQGPEGTFTNEIVIPFVRSAVAHKTTSLISDHQQARGNGFTGVQVQASPENAPVDEPRSFLPGSEWLFAKIYGSPAYLDEVLIGEVKPLAANVISAGKADCWFFIRYHDPHLHLRVRFHGDPETLNVDLLPRIRECTEQQLRKGTIWKVQLDTYEREVERYGGFAGVSIAERLFQIDSELAVDVLDILSGCPDVDLRWRLVICTVDRMLTALGLAISSKYALVSSLCKAYEHHFVINDRYKKQVSDKFRKERALLEHIIATSGDLDIFPPQLRMVLGLFSERLKVICNELIEKRRAGEIGASVMDLAGSYVHMHLNRMFSSAPNAHEVLLYDFLARIYDSVLAKEKRSTR